jgi:hypothetical protein
VKSVCFAHEILIYPSKTVLLRIECSAGTRFSEDCKDRGAAISKSCDRKAPELPEEIRWPFRPFEFSGLCKILIAEGNGYEVIDFLERTAVIDSLHRYRFFVVAAQPAQRRRAILGLLTHPFREPPRSWLLVQFVVV